MLSLFVSILVLGFVVFIHELGHFIVAKRAGVFVEEFGFGLPPRIFGKKIGNTIYSVNIFPFGGFVRLYGEDEIHDEQSVYQGKISRKAFYAQKPWKKFMVLIAGITMNFLLGFMIIWLLFAKGTQTLVDDSSRSYANDVKVAVLTVVKHSPAQDIGLEQGDAIVMLQSGEYSLYPKRVEDAQSFIQHFAGKEITLTIKRGQTEFAKTAVPRVSPPAGQGALGIELGELGTVKYPFFQAGWYALQNAFQTSIMIFKFAGITFKNIIVHGTLANVSGPIGIVSYGKNVISLGLDQILTFIAMISLNLAAVNIWPIPAFDGGRLAFVLWEWITKKPVAIKWENLIHAIGMVALIGLLVLVTIGDIRKLL